MNNILKAFLILLATLIIPESTRASTLPTAVILKPSNTLTLFGVVNEGMVAKVAKKIPTLTSDTIYVQLITPGGSVLSGKRIIDQLLGLQAQGKKIVCVAHIAISMGFVILQSPACPVRQVVNGSILMQHQASAGLEGPVMHLLSQVTALLVELNELNVMQANRLQLSVDKFKALTVHDYWLNSGLAAIQAKAADSLGTFICSPVLIKEGNVEEITYFGIKLIATTSDCPYVTQSKVEVAPSERKRNFIRDIQM